MIEVVFAVVVLFLRERAGEGPRERKREKLKQDSCPAQSQMGSSKWGSIS